MNRWWEGEPSEHYWLEITDRPDLGADLNAPQIDESGQARWSYDLLKEPADGDVVFHYWKPDQAIVASSIVRGPWLEDEVVWGARGTSARARDLEPYPRPGYRRGLQHFSLLARAITLTEIAARRQEVQELNDELQRAHGSPIYYPFVSYGATGLRPTQGYMLKMPAPLVRLLGLPEVPTRPELADVVPLNQMVPVVGRRLSTGGARYRAADEAIAVSVAIPMQRDPAIVERGLRSHRRIQNSIAAILRERGVDALSPAADDPDWDIAWRSQGIMYVCEVKSLNASNEERQLRLGLGQVLRYRQRASRNEEASGVLALEREPTDPSWITLCEALGVRLIWPPDLANKIAAAERPPESGPTE
jgi:hypothetical protein